MSFRFLLSVSFFLLATLPPATGQPTGLASSPDLLAKPWPAHWIAPPNVSLRDYGVYHFRRTIDLAAVPGSFAIHISADNRYKLYVNGVFVSEGPARGDVQHWRYETLDLARHLKAGRNVLAVVVWNFGEHATISQMSHKTGLVVQGVGATGQVANTNDQWRVLRNPAYTPIPYGPISFDSYYVAGPGEQVDASQYPWNWQKPEYDDTRWQKPRLLDHAVPHGVQSFDNWQLVARTIPALERLPQRFADVRRASGVTVPTGFLAGTHPLTIPPNTKAVLLLDQRVLTTAYPQLLVSGGKGSQIKVQYSEALWDANHRKGNRDEVEGRTMIGNHDLFRPDGGADRLLETLFYRTFRYVQLEIQTQADSLTLHDASSIFSAYPFRQTATFGSSDPELGRIWDVGWRTARLCAYETYMDCPYYEQLQYIGDTRIQALVSLYNSGDDRLMRNALTQFDDSRIPEGITMSRYPSELPQFIPPFSLLWVSMAHDYWMHRQDDAFVRGLLPGITQTLGWFERQVNREGLIGELPYWNFIDHSYATGKITAQGGPNLIANNLIFAYSLQQAALLFRHFGRTAEADHYQTLARQLARTAYERGYDARRQLMADTPGKKSFSQQVNILAVLTDAVPAAGQAALLRRTLSDTSLIRSTIYFRFYHAEALQKTGLANEYVARLSPWRTMLSEGLTTFAEMEENTRSDCHAWSASPNYHLLSLAAGIVPASPGFKTVRIQPALGSLTRLECAMPHPQGEISMSLTRSGKAGITGKVILPPGLSGSFVWNGKTTALKSGLNALNNP